MPVIENKWDALYQQRQDQPGPAFVLADNAHLLPEKGQALDLACGRGGNALFMAKKGLNVAAWDSSQVAIDQLNLFAESSKLNIKAEVRDVVQQPPEPESVDVLVVSLYLERGLCPVLIRAIRPGGLLFYQTFCRDKVSVQGPSNLDYLLADNELLQLFSAMKVRVYREEALLGNHQQGLRNQALLVAEKP